MKTNHRRKVAKKTKGQKGAGHEYWGRRSAETRGPRGRALRDPGAFTKDQTHRAERRKAKKEIDEKTKD